MHEHNDDTGASMEMPRYKSHKQVWALEIAIVEGTKLEFRDQGYAGINVPAEMFFRYHPKSGDFYVQYEDGYKSFSPRKAFLDGYTRI